VFPGQFQLLYDFAQRPWEPQWGQQSAIGRAITERISNRLALELMQTMANLEC
jgi:hypothetical protein